MKTTKSKAVAVILALFIGGFGAHKFYTGRTAEGLLSLFLFWTFIPAFLAGFEALYYVFCSQESWQNYCK